MSRRKGRILAFQALYSWDVTKASVDELMTFEWLKKYEENSAVLIEPTEKAKEQQTFASLIIAGTIDHIDEVDALIEKNLSSNWSKDRLNKVTLAILRTAVYEIIYQSVSPTIVIDEAVNISREYGPDDAYKFVNAILDKIGKEKNAAKA